MSINALLNTRLAEVDNSSCCSSQPPLVDTCKNFANKNAILWVQAALEMKSEIQSLQNKRSPINQRDLSYSSSKGVPSASPRRISASKRISAEKEGWSKGSGLREAANWSKFNS